MKNWKEEFDFQLSETKFASSLRGLLYQKELREDIEHFIEYLLEEQRKEMESTFEEEKRQLINDMDSGSLN